MNITELETLIDQYGTDILRFCRTICGNRYDADDLYQETLLVAMRKLDILDDRKNVKSYLLSVAVNLHKRSMRDNAVHRRIASSDSYEALIENGWDIQTGLQDDPENISIQQEALETIRLAVFDLPQKYRIPICLFYASGMSIAEIADCLKLPKGSVKSRLHRGKLMIKKHLEVAGYER